MFSIERNWSIAEILSHAPLTPVENKILLMHVAQLTKAQLITQDSQTLSTQQVQDLSRLFQRRILGEPIAYILGRCEFYSLELKVTEDVLIPRSDTELLVDLALKHLPNENTQEKISVLDLGTGSGAISIIYRKRFSRH